MQQTETPKEATAMCQHHDNPIDSPVRLVASEIFDRHYAALSKFFPGIARSNPRAIYQMARYEAQREVYRHDTMQETPIVPDRIKARHPFAH